MNMKQAEIMEHGRGFIAALDQSGGSTPKALERYGIAKDSYSSEEEMFRLVHEMRTRIIMSPAFSSERILGAILFEKTMDSTVAGKFTADYLWEEKGIVPFLKVDKGLADLDHGVQMMKPITGLDALLEKAVARHVFGTKMRSVIKSADPSGIDALVAQQFEYAGRILDAGLVPIVEPEVDIHSEDKAECEVLMKQELLRHLDRLPEDRAVILKLTLPDQPGFFTDLAAHPRVMRVAALSGGYSRDEAVALLAENPGVIASFSRALVEGLTASMEGETFHRLLRESIDRIYEASAT